MKHDNILSNKGSHTQQQVKLFPFAFRSKNYNNNNNTDIILWGPIPSLVCM